MKSSKGVTGMVKASSGGLTPSKVKNGQSQPITGKLGHGMQSMPGSKGQGQGVTAAPSQKITGKVGRGMSSMGSGGVIDGFVR